MRLLSLLLLLVATARATRSCGSSTLRALVVGDIHDAFDAISELRRTVGAWLDDIDAVVCTGDLTTMPIDATSAAQPTVRREYDARAARALRALVAFGKPVYFVPGNHDPPALFSNASGADPVAGARNAHGRALRLAPGLRAVGWGGSSAAVEGGAQVWPAHPYAEAEVAAGYERLLRAADASSAADCPDAGCALLWLVHCGPAGIGTSAVNSVDADDLSKPGVRPQPIDAGSGALRAVLSRDSVQRRAVLAVHGHTHAGVGSAFLGRVLVLNPGSLRHGGQFGLLRLERAADGDGAGWDVAAFELHRLRDCAGAGKPPHALRPPCDDAPPAGGRAFLFALAAVVTLAVVLRCRRPAARHDARVEAHSAVERARCLEAGSGRSQDAE